ncbi:MAG: hypothetical protein HC901_02615 [Bdellovibrionaceae bacterium]|nr:hypothetical protein [Pseudobdellovibrionaceae bacterium]
MTTKDLQRLDEENIDDCSGNIKQEINNKWKVPPFKVQASLQEVAQHSWSNHLEMMPDFNR